MPFLVDNSELLRQKSHPKEKKVANSPTTMNPVI